MVAPGGATAVASAEGAAFGMAVALAVAGAALAALGAWTFLSLRRRVAEAERQAAEAARNAEIADVAALLRCYPDAAMLQRVAEIIRGWADEEPRALWERLRAESRALRAGPSCRR